MHQGGEALAGGAGREQAQTGLQVRKPGQHLFPAHEGQVHRRQGGALAKITLVFQADQGAVLGRGKVHPGDAHIRLGIKGREQAGRQAGQRRGICGGLKVKMLGQDAGDLMAVQMEGRRGEVGRRVAGQLNDKLPQVGFGELDALALKKRPQPDFMGGHGLGLDGPFNPVTPCHLQNKVPGFSRIPGQVDGAAPVLHLVPEDGQVFRPAVQHGYFGRPHLTPPVLPPGRVGINSRPGLQGPVGGVTHRLPKGGLHSFRNPAWVY